jgi:hypothetical protein
MGGTMSDGRNLGFWPTIFKIYHDRYRCSGMTVQALRLSGPLEKEHVRMALVRIIKRHPLMRSKIVDPGGPYYQFEPICHVDDDSAGQFPELPLYVVRRESSLHWLTAVEEELNRDFEAGSLWLWRVILVLSGGGGSDHEIIIVIHHSIADGPTVVGFTHDMLSCCGQIAQGKDQWDEEEELPLLPSVEHMLPPETAKPASASGYEDKRLKKDLTLWEYMEFKPIEERRARWIGRIIDPEILNNLEKRCNAESVSLNSALTAALLLAASGERNVGGNLRLAFPFNLRQYCKPRVGAEHFGCYTMMQECVYTVKENESFWELARHCQGVSLQRMITAVKQELRTIPKQFHKAFLISAMSTNLDKADKEQHFQDGPVLSYFGQLNFNKEYGPLSLTEWYGGIPQLAGLYQLFLISGIMHGKLFCGFSYTDPLLSAEAAEHMADGFSALLNEASM